MQFRKVLIVIIQLVVLAIADVVLLFLFVFFDDYLIDAMTSLFVIIPVIISINLVLGIFLYLIKQRKLCIFVFINIIIAPLVYYEISQWRYEYLMSKRYQHYYFSYKQEKFDIQLEKQSNGYTFTNIIDKSNGLAWAFWGDYKRDGDSIILKNDNKKYTIIGQKLIGYPTNKDTLLLKKEK